MKDLLEVIVKNLVEDHSSISIKETRENDVIILELSISPDEVGKVIGKQGKIAMAIRSVVKACASYRGEKVLVKIL